MKPLLVLLAVISMSGMTFGQYKYWEQLNGPNGGYVHTVSIDSTQRLVVGSGAAGIFTSTNNGDTWNPLNKGLRQLQIKRIESGPDGYIYMYNHINDIARFHDIDIGWEYIDPWEIDGLPNIEDIHAAPNGMLFVAAYRQGIRRSTDHGTTFHWTTWFEDDPARKKFTFRRIANTASGDTIYALNDSGYVYRSIDDGDSWALMPGRQPLPKVLAECFEVSRGGDLIIASQRAIPGGKFYRSSDQGATWDTVFSHSMDHVAYALVRSSANGDLYATTHSPSDSRDQTHLGGIFRSTDNGATWVERDGSEHGDDKFSMAVNREGIIFHGSVAAGVESSTDRGRTWVGKNDGLFVQFLLGTAVNSKNDLFAVTAFTLYRSTTGGDQWRELPIEQIESSMEPIVRVSTGDIVYHGSFYGLYRSSDNGDHWVHVLEGDSTNVNNHFYNLETAPNGWVYASSEKTGLMVSKANGALSSWEKVPNLPSSLKIIGMTFAAPDTMYISTDVSTCWRSTNFGINWKEYSSGIAWAKTLAHHPNGTVIAQLAHDIKVMPIGDTVWQKVFPTPALDTMRTWALYSMFMDRQNNLLVTSDSGIWKSSAPFVNWEQVGYGTTVRDYRIDHYCNVSQIVQNKNTGILYASSRGQSMFRSKHADLGVKLSKYVSLPEGQNYPNPFGGQTSIELNVAEAGHAELEVYSALGEQIVRESKGNLPIGKHTFMFDGSELASGNYLYIFRIDGKPVARGWMQVIH